MTSCPSGQCVSVRNRFTRVFGHSDTSHRPSSADSDTFGHFGPLTWPQL